MQALIDITRECKDYDGILKHTAAALLSLTASAENVQQLVDKRLHVTIEQVSAFATNTCTLACLLGSLSNLVEHSSERDAFVSSDKLVKCLLKFSGSSDNAVVLNTTKTLALLAAESKNKAVLVDKGVVWSLIQLLTDKQAPNIILNITEVLLLGLWEKF